MDYTQIMQELQMMSIYQLSLLSSYYSVSSIQDIAYMIMKEYFSNKATMLKGTIVSFFNRYNDIRNVALQRSDKFEPYNVSNNFLKNFEEVLQLNEDFSQKRKSMAKDQMIQYSKKISEKEKELKTTEDWKKIDALNKLFFDVKGVSSDWIINSYINGTLNRLEDIKSRLVPAIERFKKLQETGIIDKNINIESFNGLKGLEDYLEPYMEKKVETKKEIAREGSDIILDTPNIKILRLKTQDASCYYGQGTRWCTAATTYENMFEDYYNAGELYVIIPKKPTYKREKYQLFVDNDWDGRIDRLELRDEKDEEINISKLLQQYPDINLLLDIATQFILDRTKYMGKKLVGADFSNRYLKGYNFSNSDLTNANFQGSNLRNANFENVNLQGASLQNIQNLDGSYFEGANLQDVNLSGSNLQGAQLEHINLENANLKDTNLIRVNLLEANMKNTNLENSSLQGSILKFANLSYANFQNANLQETDMSNTILEGTNLQGADLTFADIRDANLTNANLTNANLSHANLSNVIIENTIFTNSILDYVHSESLQGTPKSLPNDWKLINGYLLGPRADISFSILNGVDLQNINLNEARLTGASIQNANLEGANLQEAILDLSDFKGSNLSNVNFKNTNLQYTKLKNVNLSFANLTGANLPRVDLRDVNLQGADLRNADLRNTDLRGAKFDFANFLYANLEGANLEGVNIDQAINLEEQYIL